MMELVFRRTVGPEVSPEQYVRASAAVDDVLATSRHSVWDALTAMDYQLAWDDCQPGLRGELGEEAPHHRERLALFDRLQDAASNAAGELVWLSLRQSAAQ